MGENVVQTEVTRECGQWAVYVVVIDPDGISRRRLSTHRNAREAEVWASVVSRAAHRRRGQASGPSDRPGSE